MLTDMLPLGQQVTVWGDYGSGDRGGERSRGDRMDKKTFMGMAQIALDDLDLGRIVIGWYKLFSPTIIVNTASQDPNMMQDQR